VLFYGERMNSHLGGLVKGGHVLLCGLGVAIRLEAFLERKYKNDATCWREKTKRGIILIRKGI